MIVRARSTSRRLLLGAAVPALVVALVVGWTTTRADGERQGRCELFAQTAERRQVDDVGSGPRVVVVGDSWSVGLGLDDPSRSWPSRLPGHVHVDGFSGSGFSAGASPCGAVSYAGRAPAAVRAGAAVVVVEGGLNDWDATDAEIAAGFERLMRTLDTVPGLADDEVVVVGPASAPSRVRWMPRVEGLLAGLSEQHGATYVSTSDLALGYLPDRLHPTASGQAVFGDRVAAAVTALLD